jgi:NADH dehydrogenase [ubiquinone] 1 alpha subcomplex assembly factor 5
MSFSSPPSHLPAADAAMRIFDRQLLRQRRNRAAPGLASHDFLLQETAERLAERLVMIRRDFTAMLDLGCHHGIMQARLVDAGKASPGFCVHADLSPGMIHAARLHDHADRMHLVADEETLPFAAASFDLIVSNLGLHWVNDLPGCLLQIRRALRPDGFFIAAMLGGETLVQLRHALLSAEVELHGGASPRISPMANLQDMAGLMQRAGFALPVIDHDALTVCYPDFLRLLRDLRGMGASNALYARSRRPMSRTLLAAAAGAYASRFVDDDGMIPASFDVIYLAGWGPAPDRQQQPARRGSARHSLTDALKSRATQPDMPAQEKN